MSVSSIHDQTKQQKGKKGIKKQILFLQRREERRVL
jgi:hypothetical protein